MNRAYTSKELDPAEFFTGLGKQLGERLAQAIDEYCRDTEELRRKTKCATDTEQPPENDQTL